MKPSDFQELIWQKGRELYREMPWRQDTQPYYVLVSELMLQQTQVDRVIPKFLAFTQRFPDVASLAAAPLSGVLVLWSGLGYNRRAKFLHEAARKIVEQHGGVVPETYEALVGLPGIGPNTAGAILAYSFNQPVVFIETNVRSVYFFHFFPQEVSVSDAQLKEVVAETIDREHPREWYWAIMDYGSWLKRQGLGALSVSTHYKKQPPLKGSLREVRGLILKQLAISSISEVELRRRLPDDERFDKALADLKKEGLVVNRKQQLALPEG